jgi:hypothetical protein
MIMATWQSASPQSVHELGPFRVIWGHYWIHTSCFSLLVNSFKTFETIDGRRLDMQPRHAVAGLRHEARLTPQKVAFAFAFLAGEQIGQAFGLIAAWRQFQHVVEHQCRLSVQREFPVNLL